MHTVTAVTAFLLSILPGGDGGTHNNKRVQLSPTLPWGKEDGMVGHVY